jgi:hypothetical protein
MWAQKREAESTSEAHREEWRRQKELSRQQREREERERRESSLSAVDRSSQFRKLLDQLSLSAEDLADLKRRGLTDEEIKLGGFKSVEAWQKLDFEVDHRLPGVSINGCSLLVKPRDEGYLCPIKNEQGLIVGCQLRRRTKDDTGRYRWLTSQTKKRPHGTTSHLPNGELPVSVHRPTELKSKSIGLCEGTGVKPFVAAQRLGQIVIGAAAANFASSPESTLAALAQATAETGTQEVILYADGGAIANRHIMRQYRKTYELLDEYGYSLTVGWWGQTSSSAPDIDELSPNAQITYISWQEFTGDSASAEESVRPETEPNPAEYQAYNQRIEEEERLAEAASQDQQQQWRSQFPDRAKHAWNKLKKFTPTHTINSRYFDFEVPGADYLVGIKSGLGSGKTQWLSRVIELLPDEGWIALGYRNSLLLQSSERWDFNHLHIHDAFGLVNDPHSKIACCVDSLGHFQPGDFDDKNLILDEGMNIINHLLVGDTLKDRRPQILEKFTEAVKRAKRVFILDGMLADWAVEYIQQLRGNDLVIKVGNEFKSEPLHVNFYLGAIKVDEPRPNDKSPLIAQIKESVEPIVICSDSQLFCEAIEEILIDIGMQGIRIDSKTIGKDISKEFLKNPDVWIKATKPEYVILSPTAESGIDISIKDYFKDQYCFFFGVISVDAMLQFLGRIRDTATERWVWCTEFGLSDTDNLRSPFPKQVEKAMQQFLIEDGLRTIEGLDRSDLIAQLIQTLVETRSDEHYEALVKIKAIQNHERSNLRNCLLESLIKAGHNVNEFTGDRHDDAAGEYKEKSEEIKQKNSADIFNAPDIAPSMAETISRNYSATWEDRCKVIKAQLKKRLPGIESSERWTTDFIYKTRYEDRQIINKCQRYWLLLHPEAAKLQQQERWHRWAGEEKVFLGDIRSEFSKVWALQQLGILELIESRGTWTNDSLELLELLEQGKNKRIASALGVGVGQSTPVSYLRRVLSLVGVKLKVSRKRESDGQISYYSIDTLSLCDPDRLVILSCVERRLQKYVTGDVPVIEWKIELKTANCHTPSTETVAETEAVAEMPLNQPQQQTDKSLQPVQVSAIFSKNKSKTCTASSESILDPTGTFTSEEIPEEELQDAVGLLMNCSDPEMFKVIIGVIQATAKQLASGFKQRVWATLPQWKRSELVKWKAESA